ncbi:short transient receptor potential channel 4-like isoform X2 [Amphiura filiformis]|uniref:short transient receptor potential channel 4-like isoform X2 n=1 Tax=Amphiura filiformis TaxID=82378 RepID=UPI003B213901
MATINAISQEERFHAAVRDGDVAFVETALEKKEELRLDINAPDRNQRPPLTVAIVQGNLLIIKLLLQHDARVGDGLLRAVDTQFLDAVKLICKHAETLGDDRCMDIIECRSENDDYHPDITPIILAAHHNNYQIIKSLLRYGAVIPDPESADSQRTEKHTLQHSVGTLNVYRALASEFYISLTSIDPIGTAFTLSDKLKEMSDQEYEFRAEYIELSEAVEQYAADMLGQARDSEELTTILTHSENRMKKAANESPTGAQLHKVFQAIGYSQKKFVAHPHCQQLLIKRFYGHMSYMRDWGMTKQMGVSFLLLICYPALSLAYIFSPSANVLHFVRTPYVKFLMDLGSRLTFLLFLLLTTIIPPKVVPLEDDVELQGTSHFSQIPVSILVLILIWIIGMTWAEVKSLWDKGLGEFLQSGTKVMDFVILALYWITLTLNLMSYLMVLKESEEVRLAPTASSESFSVNRAPELVDRQVRQAVEDTSPTTIDPTTEFVTDSLDEVNTTQPTFYRLELDPMHPALVADAVYAVATVITFLRLLVLTVSSQLVGPLQISLGGMLFDIGKFILVFAIVWFAFALGLNQIYQAYQEIEYTTCLTESDDCRPGPFYDVSQSMLTLFWALFGLEPLEIIKLDVNGDPGHYFTEAVGTLLYALYLMFAVVVMLNALIAMMSNTYTRVEENSDTEWKFARAKMWTGFLQSGGAVPPPFNVIPCQRTVKKMIKAIQSCLLCHRRRTTQSMIQRKGEAEEQYEKVIRLLVERYILDKTSAGGDSEVGVTRADIMGIRNDVAVFRYETFKSLKAAEDSFDKLKGVLSDIRDQLQRVDEIGEKTNQLDTNVRDLKDRTVEIRDTVDDMTSTLMQTRQKQYKR